MSEDDLTWMSRRNFIKTAAAATTVAGLATACGTSVETLPVPKLEPTDSMRAKKRKEDSPIAIASADDYHDDLFELLKPLLKNIDLPNLKNKTVLIKPNMIDVISDLPITTHPQVIKAAVDLVAYLGAKEIIVGEGSGNTRDTDYLLNASGHGQMIRKLGLKYVDLNHDDLERMEMPESFSKLDHLYMPKTVLHADALVSLPKMKTHHWARITCSMKNLYGTVPGRKYGWPKNILHWHGIDNCILDLNMHLKPAIQLVDAIVAMEGDGPIAGTPKKTDFMMLGTDAAAVDSTCARIMGIDPQNVPYLRVAGEVFGNIDPVRIKAHGTEIAKIATTFKPAPNFDVTGKRLRQVNSGAAGS